ncbi:MAG: EAL domain-containing protein [Kineosporiaceae bacterium]
MSRRREAVTVTAVLAAIAALGVACWGPARLGDASLTATIEGRDSLPWWLLAVLAAAAERAEIVVPSRRQSRSTTLSDSSLVIGLIFWDPLAMVTGRAAGVAAQRILRGRCTLAKVAVNTSLVVAESLLARVVVLELSEGRRFPHVLAAVGVLAGVAAANLLSATVTATIVGRLDRLPVAGLLGQALREDAPGAVIATSFGLAAAYALHDEASSLVVLAVCALAAAAVHRSQSRLITDNRKLNGMHRFNRRLAACETNRELTEQTLELARVLLHAEHAEMVLPGAERGQPLTQVCSPLDGDPRWSSRLPEDLPPVLLAAAHATRPYTLIVRGGLWHRLREEPVVRGLLGRRVLDRLQRVTQRHQLPYAEAGEAYLRSLGLTDGVTVPLQVEDRHLGCLIVAGRMAALGFDAADVDLLQTLASQAAIALHRSELLDRVQWEATHDSVTALPNRLTFNRATQEALLAWSLGRAAAPRVPAQRGSGSTTAPPASRAPVTGIAMLDLDRFHDVNDTFGHDVADDLLRQVSDRLATAAGDDALVARLGSDEFGVLVAGCASREHLLDVVQRLVGSLAQPITVGETSLQFSASVGLAVVEDPEATVTSLVVQADVALQAAKQMSGPIVEYSPDIDNRAPHRLAIATDLRGALREGDLAIHVQPQASLSTGCLVGVEALVRWHHPTRGLVFPDEFIPVAETTGLVGELTQVVLDKALAAVAGYRSRGVEVPIAVNLSARSLVDAELVASVQRALRRHRLPAHLLTLEITESSVMDDPQRAIRTLTQLRALGITLAVDDFGTGYSSLSYLKRLPVQEVKIDKSFVMTLPVDADNASIVRSIVDLGANLGLRVIAEGVEDAQSWNLLAAMGCDVAQGYHLARPMPAEDLLGWLDASPVVSRPSPAIV